MKILGLNINKCLNLAKGVAYTIYAEQEGNNLTINLLYDKNEDGSIEACINVDDSGVPARRYMQYLPKKDMEIPDLIPQDLDSPTAFDNNAFTLELGDASEKDTIQVHLENFIECQ